VQVQYNWLSENSVALSGIIDETVQLAPIFSGRPSEIWVDFHDLVRMNSHGVRSWLNMLLEFKLRVHYVRAPVLIAEQFSPLPGFFQGGSVVESFDALYVCSSCGLETVQLLTVGKDVMAGAKSYDEAPEKLCSRCSHSMDFDHEPSSYLGFLSAMQWKA
jgi:hypothetical protein